MKFKFPTLIAILVFAEMAFACVTEAAAFNADVEKTFSSALQDQSQGRLIAARKKLLFILDQDSSLNRVRLELALNYFLNGDDTESRQEFITVLEQDIPPQVEENIMFHLRAIDARKPFIWDFGWSYLPKTAYKYKQNSGQVYLDFGPGSLPFDIDDIEDKGHGVKSHVSATKRFNNQASIGLTVNSENYEKSKFDFMEVTLNSNFMQQFGRKRAAYGPVIRQSYTAKSRYTRQVALQASLEIPMSEVSKSSFSMEMGKQKGFGANINLNGKLWKLSTSYEGAEVMGVNQATQFSYENFESDRSRGESYKNKRLEHSISILRDLDNDLSIKLSYGHKDFDEKLFPFSNVRRDKNRAYEVSFFKRIQWVGKRFIPGFIFKSERNKSSVGVYDYSSQSITFTLRSLF